MKIFIQLCLLLALTTISSIVSAGSQIEEPLLNSVKALMQRSVSDKAVPMLTFATKEEGQRWLKEMSERLKKRIPDTAYREDFLRTVHYEASRAGLDP